MQAFFQPQIRVRDRCYTIQYKPHESRKKNGEVDREKLTPAQAVAAVAMYDKAVAAGECEEEEKEGEDFVRVIPTLYRDRRE